jgi:membrane protease YdiL (CAAX protease family)
VSWTAGLLLSFFLTEPDQESKWPVAGLIIFTMVLAPPIETVLFQAIPISIVRFCKGSMCTQVLVSAALFTAGHFLKGIRSGLSAGVIGGFYLAFAYARWRMISKRKAFWITTACHLANNTTMVILALIVRNLRSK